MRINVFRDNSILNRVQRRFETYGIQTMTEQSQHVEHDGGRGPGHHLGRRRCTSRPWRAIT